MLFVLVGGMVVVCVGWRDGCCVRWEVGVVICAGGRRGVGWVCYEEGFMLFEGVLMIASLSCGVI